MPLSQPCLARKDFLRLGLSFFMVMLASPNLIIFSFPLEQAFTTDFLPPEICLLGLLHFILDLSILAITLIPMQRHPVMHIQLLAL